MANTAHPRALGRAVSGTILPMETSRARSNGGGTSAPHHPHPGDRIRPRCSLTITLLHRSVAMQSRPGSALGRTVINLSPNHAHVGTCHAKLPASGKGMTPRASPSSFLGPVSCPNENVPFLGNPQQTLQHLPSPRQAEQSCARGWILAGRWRRTDHENDECHSQAPGVRNRAYIFGLYDATH